MSWYDDDYVYDEYYGSKDTVSYCRWLSNRSAIKQVSEELHIPVELLNYIRSVAIPGKTKLSDIPDMESAKNLYHRIKKIRNAQDAKAVFQSKFHENDSRKMKLRMNKLCEIPEMYVLRQLMEAEEFNIKAKEGLYKYQDCNYGKKVECLRNAISKLPETQWKFWWQGCSEGLARYIFYVELPGGQVSWHGTDTADMVDVPKDKDREWDGALAATLPRIIHSVQQLCPSLMVDKFNKDTCTAEIYKNMESARQQFAT